MPLQPVQHALALVVEERIAELVSYRTWHRTRHPSLRNVFAFLEDEHKAELKALLKLRRRARNIARAAEVQRTTAVDAGVATWMSR